MTKRRIFSITTHAAKCLFGTAILTLGLSAPSLRAAAITLPGTGTHVNGLGQDTDYSIIANSILGTGSYLGNAYLVTGKAAGAGWVQNSPVWVSWNADQNNASRANIGMGTQVYELDFILPLGQQGLSLTGSLLTDDFATVSLNCAVIAACTPGTKTQVGSAASPLWDVSSPASFALSSGFKPGLNSLFFTVDNANGGPTGLAVSSVTVTSSSSVPEPSTYMMLGTGLGGLIIFFRRKEAIDRKKIPPQRMCCEPC